MVPRIAKGAIGLKWTQDPGWTVHGTAMAVVSLAISGGLSKSAKVVLGRVDKIIDGRISC